MPETPAPQDPMIVRLPLIRFFQTEDGRVVGEVTGSTLVPPGMTNGRYLSASGYTTDIGEATDFRGEPGATIIEGETVEVVGPVGPAGMDGRSAYEIWLEAGNVGSQAVYLASLKGDVGERGPVGATGESVVGPKGEKGDAGNTGAAGQSITGPKGDTGAAGQSITGSKGDKGDTGSAGQSITGPKGETGATGPAASTLLGTFTLSETAVVAITAGARRLTVTVPSGWGVTTGQNLLCFPVSVPSSAYATHDVIPTAANTISVGVTAPLLAVLASYSITCRLVRIS